MSKAHAHIFELTVLQQNFVLASLQGFLSKVYVNDFCYASILPLPLQGTRNFLRLQQFLRLQCGRNGISLY
jgi:hypothetical protein